nr:hypothetical protein [Tanacetum cinerariifolium]
MDPEMVDSSAFLVDLSPASSVVDPTKLMGFVSLVDALLLSNPKPILQLGIARLMFRYLSVLPSSSVVACAFATFPCIGELEAIMDKLFDEGGSGEKAKPPRPIFATLLQPRRQKKQKTTAVDVDEPSHPVKRLRDDHGTLGGTSVADSSHHSGASIGEADVDSFARPFASVITTTIVVTSTVDPAAVTKEKIVEPSLFFAGSASGDGIDHAMGGFANLSGSDFLIGCIRTVINPDTDLQKVAQLLVKEVEAAEAIHLYAKTSQFEVVEKSLRDEVQTLTDRNPTLEKEKGELDVKAADLAASVKVREQEVADLDAVVTSVKLQNDNLADQVHKLETSSAGLREKVMTYENCMKLAIAKCLNSIEYLSTLGATIGKAVEKGMQDGLSTGITHGAEELKSNKDASIDTIMNFLHLEDSLAEKLVTSYGPSHLGPSFPVSSARLASLLRYTKSLGLKLVFRTFERSKLISRASLFPTKSTSDVLSVGMPISVRITASVPYVNENGMSSLLDFIIVRPIVIGPQGFSHDGLCACIHATRPFMVSLITTNRQDLRLIALAFFTFVGKVPFASTCLLKCVKFVEAILLRASAVLFSLLGICLIENALKLPVKNKQDKDKIRTKPDQIKKKQEAWKSPAVSKASHSQ